MFLHSPSHAALLARCLENNLRSVERRIAEAARAAGRPADDVALVAVTKAVQPDVARALVALGPRDLGENRVDELERKAAALGAATREVRWHFVGHLQTNKARRVARIADVVHSVDSVRLARFLGRVAAEEGRRLAVYLQVALTGEATKHGLDEAVLDEAVDAVAGAPALELAGLMAMGPRGAAPEATSEVFARAAALARDLEARHGADRPPGARFAGGRVGLSMGMSGDLEAAIAAGSTCVRIGSDLFEESA